MGDVCGVWDSGGKGNGFPSVMVGNKLNMLTRKKMMDSIFWFW